MGPVIMNDGTKDMLAVGILIDPGVFHLCDPFTL
jgi:hypothetical protein